MSRYLIDGGAHVDTPLSNLAVKAFQGEGEFIASQVFPMVNVGKQSDFYYTIDKDSWLRRPDTRRSPKSDVNRAEWQASSDNYFADNYALGADHALETLTNADAALQVRQNDTMFVVEGLRRDWEIEVANLCVTSGNLGLTFNVTSKWSDRTSGNSDPLTTVLSAHAYIEDTTGVRANVAIMDHQTHRQLRYHADLLELTTPTVTGIVPDSALAQALQVDRLIVGRGIYNAAKEGQTASLVNIWGNNLLIAHVSPPAGLQTRTLGLHFNWRPAGFPAPFAVEVYEDSVRAKKKENVDAHHFSDAKLIATDLGVLIANTL